MNIHAPHHAHGDPHPYLHELLHVGTHKLFVVLMMMLAVYLMMQAAISLRSEWVAKSEPARSIVPEVEPEGHFWPEGDYPEKMIEQPAT